MDMTAPIAIDLPPEALAALRHRARAERMSPATMAHKLLLHALQADCGAAKASPEQGEDCDPTLFGRLRTLLAVDIEAARSWKDLQERLSNHGYTFRERDGGLALHCTATAAHICKASDLGWSHADLIRQFGAPFPGHAPRELARRMLHRAHDGDHPDLFPDLSRDEAEIILIEDD